MLRKSQKLLLWGILCTVLLCVVVLRSYLLRTQELVREGEPFLEVRTSAPISGVAAPCSYLTNYVVLATVAGPNSEVTESHIQQSCVLRNLPRVRIVPTFSELDLHRFKKQHWMTEATYNEIITGQATDSNSPVTFAAMRRMAAHIEIWRKVNYEETIHLVVEDGTVLDSAQIDQALALLFNNVHFDFGIIFLGDCPSCNLQQITSVSEFERMLRYDKVNTMELFSSRAYLVGTSGADRLLGNIYPIESTLEVWMAQVVKRNQHDMRYYAIAPPTLAHDPPAVSDEEGDKEERASQVLIPKQFHRIWLGSKEMPEQYRENGRKWLRMHPGWILKDWDDAAVSKLALVNRELFDRQTKMAGKADILRLELLHQFGGVYLDTDFEPLQNLEIILRGVSGFAAWQEKDSMATGIMGSVPGHPMMRKLVEGMAANVLNHPIGIIVVQTGPSFLRETVFRNPEIDFRVFSNHVFYPYTWYQPRPETYSKNAYAVHHWAHSWA